MISDLSKSKNILLDVVAELIDDPFFIAVIKYEKIASFVQNGRLYWNLGHNQGFVVIDPSVQKVYRVFETDESKEPLTDKFICDPSTAELVLEDIQYIVEYINAVSDGSEIAEVSFVTNTRLM